MGISGKNVYFDKARLPVYYKFLAIVALASIPIGSIVSKNIGLTLGFTGLNILIGATIGLSILYRYRPQSKK
jgi:ABC-type transporter Mla maintaining outer membrane lipid asymmetry permease subunit MlaE